MWGTIALTLAGVAGGGVGASFLQGMFSRRRESAQVQQITAAAHAEIYSQYGALLKELRQDAALAREEAHGARQDARAAQLRAGEAEARAAGAENRASAAEAQLTEMSRLVRTYVPDADELLRGFGQLGLLLQAQQSKREKSGSGAGQL